MANAKQRYINTRFWNDGYVSELDPIEKLLFIYFLTNEHTNISGVYELPHKIIGIETGIDVSMIKKILPRLEKKVRYINGFVVIKNFVKHQETGSDLVRKGIVNCLKDLDKKFLKAIVDKGFYEIPTDCLDTLSIPYAKVLNYSDLDSDLDLDSSSGKKAAKEAKIYSFQEEVKKLEDSPRRDMNIIALYFSEKKPDLQTYEQFTVALKRHLRPAKDLTPFTDKQILEAVPQAKKLTDGWTIETLGKILTK